MLNSRKLKVKPDDAYLVKLAQKEAILITTDTFIWWPKINKLMWS